MDTELLVQMRRSNKCGSVRNDEIFNLWHWKVMQNLSKNWLVAWKMARNLVNFHASSWKSENLHMMGSFCWKQQVISHDIGEWRKVWRKTDLGFKNDMTNFVNFNAGSGKSENVHFDMPLLSVAFKVSAKKYRRVISHDSEKWSKLWRKTHFLFEKRHEEFDEY